MTEFTHVAGWTLVSFLWQGALIAAAAAVALRLASRAAASTRYAIACAALATMLAAPVTTIWWLQGPDWAVPTAALQQGRRRPGGAFRRVSEPDRPPHDSGRTGRRDPLVSAARGGLAHWCRGSDRANSLGLAADPPASSRRARRAVLSLAGDGEPSCSLSWHPPPRACRGLRSPGRARRNRLGPAGHPRSGCGAVESDDRPGRRDPRSRARSHPAPRLSRQPVPDRRRNAALLPSRGVVALGPAPARTGALL